MSTPSRPELSPAVISAVGIGAMVGAGLRWLFHFILPSPSLTPEGLTTVPHGIGLDSEIWTLLIINLLGAFLLGWFNGYLLSRTRPLPLWLTKGISTGMLGSFTTLSAMAVSLAIGTWALAAFPPPGATRVQTMFISGALGALVLIFMAAVGTGCAALGLRTARGYVFDDDTIHVIERPQEPTSSNDSLTPRINSLDQLARLEKNRQSRRITDDDGEPQ